MHGKLSMVSVVVVLTVGVALVASVSHAQYPPPAGGVEVQSSSTSADPGDQVQITCEVLDESGDAISTVPCTASIDQQPGDGASIGSLVATKLTNSQGIASFTLNVGSTPGLIVVSVEAEGFSSSVLVTVEGETASPPQSPIGGITPPSTGSGGLAN